MAAVVARPRPVQEPSPQPTVAMAPQLKPWVQVLLRLLTAFSAWLLVGVHVLRPAVKIVGFPPTLYLTFAIIIFCAKVRGVRVFARTPVDIAFALWLLLAVVSQLWASMVLNRVLMLDDLWNYLAIILTSWLMFRSAFALYTVDAKTATGAFLKAILALLGFACIVGILQGYGPGPLKTWAINFGIENGAAGAVTELGITMSTPRPLALYSGPNYFGFMNLIAMAVIIALTVAQGRNMSTRSVWAAALGTAVFMLGTLVAQSRTAFATSVLLFVFFLYLMFRMGRTKVLVTGVVAIGLVLVGVAAISQQLDLAYLQSTLEKKMTDDESFRARQRGMDSLIDQAVYLAPLGAGFDSRGFSIDRTGDIWSKTNSIDNGYLQAYVNHGVPGLLHVAFLFVSLWWALRLSRRSTDQHVRILRIACGLMLIIYGLFSLSGVRHAKLETSVYWMILFGLLYGSIYSNRVFGRKPIVTIEQPALAS